MNKFDLPLPTILSFVKESCHETLHDSLSEIRDLAGNEENQGKDSLAYFVKDFIRRVQFHMSLEENDLFPLIEKQKRESAIYPIYSLLDDHDEFERDLLILRKMTNGFDHAGLNEKTKHFYSRLIELERIIFNHISLENHVLYPMVVKCS